MKNASAMVSKGRPAIRDDARAAGAEYVDQEVVRGKVLPRQNLGIYRFEATDMNCMIHRLL
jgi:hypothetical protein